MEVSKLSSQLKYIESNGCTLNIEERAQLDLAFETLRNDLPTRETTLFFWGKIRGMPTCNRGLMLFFFRHDQRLLHLLLPWGVHSYSACSRQALLLVLFNKLHLQQSE